MLGLFRYFTKTIKPLLTLVLLLCIATIGNANPDSIYLNGARSHAEALDLSGPQKTAQVFISAWRSKDYETVFFTLSPQTQRMLVNVNMTLAFEKLFPTLENVSDLTNEIIPFLPEANILDTHNELEFIDAMFMAAHQHGLLPFALGANATVKAMEEQDGKVRVTIATDTPQPHEITLVMMQMKHSRNWKILKIDIPGFNAPSNFW